MSEWITVKEASELLKISRRQVINRINQGRLKSKRDGRLWYVHSSLSPEVEETEEVPETSQDQASEKSEEIKEMLDFLREQIEEKDKQIASLQDQLAEASVRHDTIVLQLTKQLEQSQKLLEYKKAPLWRRWFRKQSDDNSSGYNRD